MVLDVKKVRKRKMRPFKLGLSRPRPKKERTEESDSKSESTTDVSQVEEINVSRDTIEDISDGFLRGVVKTEPDSTLFDNSMIADPSNAIKSEIENKSILELVNNITESDKHLQPRLAETYDQRNNYEPEAGPSNIKTNESFNQTLNESIMSTESVLGNDKLGIISFYDKSEIFETTIENHIEDTPSDVEEGIKDIAIKTENVSYVEDTKANISEGKAASTDPPTEIKKEDISLIPLRKPKTKILKPKIRAPTFDEVYSTLQEYNIPKVRNLTPFYSDPRDVGDKVEIGQLVLKVGSKLARDQKPYERVLNRTTIEEWRQLLFMQSHQSMSQETIKPDDLRIFLAGNRKCVVRPIVKAPTRKQVEEWIKNKNANNKQEEIIENSIDTSKQIDELDNSQALGLNEIDNSINMEKDEKVRLGYNLS